MSNATNKPRTLQLGSYIKIEPDDPTTEQGIDYKHVLRVFLKTAQILNLFVVLYLLLKHYIS